MGNHGRLGVSNGDAGLIPLKERGKEGRRIGQEDAQAVTQFSESFGQANGKSLVKVTVRLC